MLIVTIILVILISSLILEKWLTQKSVDSLQLRVHVNGTRGKSSVAEYIAAGLSNNQQDVMAKITGIVPAIIHNGERRSIKRFGVARVQEQMNIIRLASRKRVKFLVLECMSLAPELQLLESSVFKPHIYVITNIKDDHREEMGKTIEEQSDSICDAIPGNCTVITNETRFIDKIKGRAKSRNSSVISLQESNKETLSLLPDGVFSENVSLALTVCKKAGIDHKQAEEGILKYISKSKSPLTVVNYRNEEIRFLNAFSVNDVASTEYFLTGWEKKTGHKGKISVLLNTRADRPIRTDLFAVWIANRTPSIDKIIITGDHSHRAKYSMLRAGVDKEKIFIWKKKQLINIKRNLFDIVCNGSLLAGVGNIAGHGFDIINELQ
jgi:poly-gamma-glutamate synthase PgsB/CapB